MLIDKYKYNGFDYETEYVINTLEDCGNEITKLREQVAAQAAVIEKLREALSVVMWFVPNHPTVPENKRRFDILKEALAIPADNTQILEEVRRAERERVYQVADNAYATEHVLLAIRAME